MALPIPFATKGISLEFGAYDGKVYTPSSPHQGCDWSSYRLGAYGLPILASGPGTVVFNGRSTTSGPREGHPSSAHGYSIAIRYDVGIVVHYSHRRGVAGPGVGGRVVLGTHIGNVGNTGLSSGEHLHMEAWQNGRRHNPRHFFDYSRTVTQVASASSTPFVPKPKEENRMSYTVQWNAHILTFAPEMVKHETQPGAAQFMANLTTVEDKVIGINDGQISALCEAYGVPFYAVDNAIKGQAYTIDGSRPGHFWSRQMEIREALASVGKPSIDVPALAKAIRDQLGEVGGATKSEVEAAVDAAFDKVYKES